MLKELRCEFLIEPIIEFHGGLNAVLGDNYSTNSIGKSTFLMIIDFAFGGDIYLRKNSGSIKQVGHHTFRFSFLFEELYYFSRSTDSPNMVSYCDAEYNVISEVNLDRYLALLKEKYSLPQEVTFRGAVGLYSRIWGKENYNVDKPLKAFPAEKEAHSVEMFIKLFALYTTIEKLATKISDLDESRKVIAGMHKKNFVEKLTKADLVENKNRMEAMQREVEDIQDNLLKYTINIDELTNKELLQLKTDKSYLLSSLNIINTKIKRLEISLSQSSIKSKHLKKLSTFFLNVNEDKIVEIEKFHNKLSGILRRELTSAVDVLFEKKRTVEGEIGVIDLKINSLLEDVPSPKFIVEKVYDLTIEANKISNVVKFNEERVQIESDKKELQGRLDQIVNEILLEIENRVNSELIEINKLIHSPNRKIPRLILSQRSFSYDHSENTGTGKSYADLIEFDLAVMKITRLPLVMHDSILFKNVEDVAVDKIIQQYVRVSTGKQAFIALDGINRYNVDSQNTLKASMVVSLTEERKLFNRDWR